MGRITSTLVLLVSMGLLLPAADPLRASPPGGDSVASAKAAADYTYVTITGRIIAHDTDNVSDTTNLYTFTDDKTGNIVVQIGESLIQGKGVTPSTRVTISGQVDNSHLEPRIDVENLEVVAQ
jgi:uncharacterized protein (TIGR00156 family)